ncbi:nuclear transport factor 2 family protein [Roseibium alexandrii]|uniref:nuclear transport factor 2 family protein n=1 Tax=Roseibium alexandrii TaxID=388408 RepID=UPI00374FF64F
MSQSVFSGMAHAQAYLSNWNARAYEHFPDMFHEDAEYQEIAMDHTFKGRIEIEGFLRTLAGKFPDVAWEPLDVFVESPQKLAIHWRATRTIDDKLNVVEGVSLQYLKDGKVLRNIDFRNRG